MCMCVCVLLPIEGGRYCLDGKSTLPQQPRISFVLNVMCVCLCTPRVVLFWRIADPGKNGSQTLTFPARRMEALHPNPEGDDRGDCMAWNFARSKNRY